MSTAFKDAKPWPTAQEPNPRAIPGNNQPDRADEARREFNMLLKERDDPETGLTFEQRVNNLIGYRDPETEEFIQGSIHRAHAVDEVTFGRCGELKKQLAAVGKVIDDAHTKAKAPYLEAGRAVDTEKKARRGPIDDALTKVQGLMDTFVREENARKQAEARRRQEEDRAAEQARRETEAAEARARAEANPTAAAPPPPEPAPPPPPPQREPEVERTFVRGDFGAAVGSKTVMLCEVTDYTVAFMQVERNVKVREAIDTAIKALVRGGLHEIEGVRIWPDVVASVR